MIRKANSTSGSLPLLLVMGWKIKASHPGDISVGGGSLTVVRRKSGEFNQIKISNGINPPTVSQEKK